MPTLTTIGRNMLARHKWQVRTINVLEKVFQERGRQVERYGHNDDKPDGTGQGWAVDGRSAEQLEADFRAEYEHLGDDEGATWMRLVREEVAESFAETDQDRLEEELIQVAALCVSWVETIQKRREGKDV